MSSRRRYANLDAVLVFMDEPQLVTLMSGKSRVVALAIPSDDPMKALFVGTTVSKKDWRLYLDNVVDLRYLFTKIDVRSVYLFDLNSIIQNRVMMSRIDDELSEDWLPSPQFFAENHTEEYGEDVRAADKEKLVIDGQWELTEFGHFQQRYSDVYVFLSSLDSWVNSADLEKRVRIQKAFTTRPFQGGFSYVHMFNDLNDNIPRSEQINLNEIKYASPGFVEITGREDIFEKMQELIPHFLMNRAAIGKKYRRLYTFLSKGRYLTMSGYDYPVNDTTSKFISGAAEDLARTMSLGIFDLILQMTQNNALVAAKVIMSFYRRLDEASLYFIQGRVNYPGKIIANPIKINI